MNERIDEAGRAIDAWFERRLRPVPPHAVEQLTVLIKTRRELLENLADLDDRFMNWLLSVRGLD